MLFMFAYYISMGQGSSFDFNEIVVGENNSKYIKVSGSYIILNINGTESQLSELTRDWVNKTYHNSKDIIISDTDGKRLQIEGIKESIFSQQGSGMTFYYPIRYRLEFIFDENNIKAEITSLKKFSKTSGSHKSGWYDVHQIAITNQSGHSIKEGEKNIEELKNFLNPLMDSLKTHKGLDQQ
jgi:hypothetical protein